MKRSPLIGISIGVACVIFLATFTNVVGVQTVESSKYTFIKDEVDQKELLFQTIIDIANNNEVQNEFQKNKIVEGMKQVSLSKPILTKYFLDKAYTIGVILSRMFTTSKIHFILESYEVSNKDIQKEIISIIERDNKLNSMVEKLSDEDCDCEEQGTTEWPFPVICGLLYPAAILSWVMFYIPMLIFGPNWPGFIGAYFYMIMKNIGTTLNCNWALE